MDGSPWLVLMVLVAVSGVGTSPVVPSHGINSKDPNSERASRLLFSPSARVMSPKELQNVFLKIRDNQTGNEPKTNDQNNPIRTNRLTEDERPVTKEICHSRALQKCGSVVLREFDSATQLTLEHKCRVRENFLHCMLKSRRTACRWETGKKLLTEDELRSLRQRILQVLWTARGCVIGLDSLS